MFFNSNNKESVYIKDYPTHKAYYMLNENALDCLGLKNDFYFRADTEHEFKRIPVIGERVWLNQDLYAYPLYEAPHPNNLVGRLVFDKQFVTVSNVEHDGGACSARLVLELPKDAKFIDHA